MKIVYKYPLELTSRQEIKLPEMAKILSVQFQNEQLCLWALVDPEAPTEPAVIRIVGTGQPLPFCPSNQEFIGTVQMNSFVWHLWRTLWGDGQ